MNAKTDLQWARATRDLLTEVGYEIAWAERHKELAPTVVPQAMIMMRSFVNQYYLQKYAERRALDAELRAQKAKAKREKAKADREAAKKEKGKKGRRTGSNPVLAERLAKRKAQEAQTQLRIVK